MLQNGAEINAKNNIGRSPLHQAIFHSPIFPHENCEIVNDNREIVEILLKNGAEINTQNSFGWSPIHMAAQQGKLEIVKCLVQNGVQYNAKDQLNRTPLDYACLKGHKDIVKYLENQNPAHHFKATGRHNIKQPTYTQSHTHTPRGRRVRKLEPGLDSFVPPELYTTRE